MSNYTKANVREDVENQAPKFGMPDELDARFARSAIDGKTLGLSLMKLEPNFRIPFGHKHEHQEEVYVVVRGSGRVKVEDDIVELREWDAIRFGGFKDTVKANPGYFTTIRARYELPTGVTAPQRYVYHCHIVEHEDNDMMRPFTVTA
jgi:mannose-6-phosphate isomerase-like protein (cupin superfamily)